MSANAAAPQPGKPEHVAVAYLVDSSLTLMNEWGRLVADYLNPLLTRLHEGQPTRPVSIQICASHDPLSRPQFRLAIVCYAPASTHPRPLLSTSPWIHPSILIPKLTNSVSELGLGRTGSGGTRGMAVLEGLICVFEVRSRVYTLCHRNLMPEEAV